MLSHFTRVQLCVTPWTAAHEGSSVHGILQASIQEWVAISRQTDWKPWSQKTNQSDHMDHSSVQSLSRVRLFATPWIKAPQASLSITNSRSLLKLMPIESVMPSSHLILCPLTWTTTLSNWVKLWARPEGPPKTDGWIKVLTGCLFLRNCLSNLH